MIYARRPRFVWLPWPLLVLVLPLVLTWYLLLGTLWLIWGLFRFCWFVNVGWVVHIVRWLRYR